MEKLKQTTHTACRSCGQIAAFDNENEEKITCPRCGSLIKKGAGASVSYVFAFSLSAFLLFIPALLYPLLNINVSSFSNSAGLPASIKALYTEGLEAVGLLVLLTSVAVPMSFLAGCAYLSFSAINGRKLPMFYPALRFTDFLQEWHMADVFLVGVLVSVVKLVDLSELSFGYGLYMLMFVCLFTALTEVYYDRFVISLKADKRHD